MTVKMSGDFGAGNNKPGAADNDGAFLDPSEKALFWLTHNWQYLAIAAALIVGGYTAYGYVTAAQRDKAAVANNLLAEAEVAYDKAIAAGPYGSDARRKSMEEALAKTQTLKSLHPDSKVARHAQFLAGNAWLATGDMPTSGTANTDKALAAFREYLADAKTPLERSKGTLAVANALENEWFLTQDQAKLDEAIKTYAELEKIASGEFAFMGADARIARARLLGMSGKRDEAIELLRAVMKDIHTPLASPEDQDGPGAQLAQQLRGKMQDRTLVGEARRELELLGVDALKEFPPFAEPKAAEEPAKAGVEVKS